MVNSKSYFPLYMDTRFNYNIHSRGKGNWNLSRKGSKMEMEHVIKDLEQAQMSLFRKEYCEAQHILEAVYLDLGEDTDQIEDTNLQVKVAEIYELIQNSNYVKAMNQIVHFRLDVLL